MAAHEIIPYLLTPNTRGWIVAPNYALAQKVAREVRRIVVNELQLPIESKKEISGDLYFMRLAGLRSELVVKSADTNDGASLIGDGIDYLVIDEMALIPRSTYEMYLRPTLADRQGWALFCSTPRGFNYFEKIYQYGQSEEHPEWESWQFPSTSSPYFKDDIKELERTLTRETIQQEFFAEFTSFSGKVFPMDRFKQVSKTLRYNPNLPTYATMDFGYRNAHCAIIQVDNKSDGLPTIYQIDEIALKDTKTEDFARLIKALPYHIVAYFGDPAGGGVNIQSGMSDISLFAKMGMQVRYRKDAITRNVVNGVSHVRRWFEDANGDTHFFIAKRCKKSIEAYENYRYPTHKEDQRIKEEPLKDGRFDHANDALRFGICNLFPIRSRMAGVIDW